MRKIKGLYKRGTVFWICYRANGRLYRESTGKTSQREAEYMLACRRQEIADGKLPEKRRTIDCKVAELARDYSLWAESQKSYAASKRFMIKQIVEVFGNLDVKDIDAKMIEHWQVTRLKRNKPSTVNRVLACLKHMTTKAVDWNMADEDILKRVRKVKFLKENNSRLRYLTVEECQRLIENCTEHLKPIVTIALNTGMRRGEIFRLKWSQVDLDHGFILLTDTKNGERREIPVNTSLEFLFREIPQSSESEYVFPGKTGKPMTEIKHSFTTALRKAGIQDFRFHDLRHTFASHLIMAGIDLTSVKELLGHKSITMTLRYSHLAPGHKRKAVTTLDRLLQNVEKENFSSQFSSQFTKNTQTKSHKSLCSNIGATGFEPATS